MDSDFGRPIPPRERYSSMPQTDPMPEPAPAPQPAAERPQHYKRGGGFKKFLKFLLFLLIIGAVAYGVYYWQQTRVDDLNKKLTSNNSQSGDLSSQLDTLKKQLTDLTGSGATATVDVKALGVKLTVPASLKDLTSKVIDVNYKKPTNTLGAYPTAFLSTEELDKLEEGKCAASAMKADSNPPLGYLTKTTGQYPAAVTDDNNTGTLVKQFSTYYIAYRAPAKDCFSDAKNNDRAKALRDQLAAALVPVTESQ